MISRQNILDYLATADKDELLMFLEVIKQRLNRWQLSSVQQIGSDSLEQHYQRATQWEKAEFKKKHCSDASNPV